MSEIVVYTAIAVVFSRHEDAEDASDGASQVEGGGVLWRPIADGAWTQLHVFLEMARDGSPRVQLLRNFRLVAWVLETGRVVVNDVVSSRCMWAPVDELFWQFTNTDGRCYGFRFHSAEQADECAQVVGGILNNVDEIRRLVKKMFETRTTTHEFLALLYDIGFFKLDSDRRSTMIESAHAAVASLQAPEWTRARRAVQPLYPKEASDSAVRSSKSSSGPRAQTVPPAAAAAAEDEALAEEAGIILRSTAKRSSTHHLLAQFTEVQKATLAATQSQRIDGVGDATHEDLDSVNDSPEEEDNIWEPDCPVETSSAPLSEPASVVRDERSTVFDTSELSATGSYEVKPSIPKDCISLPYKTRQELHVTYNNEFARYEGLPWAWRRLNHQFGFPLEAVPKRHVPGYAKKVPAVLQMLKESLIAHGGLLVEGVFRLAPDKDKCAEVKQSINNGVFTGCKDVHIVANLIKVWFRELPQSLFNVIPEKLIYRTCELKDAESILASIDSFPPLYASLVRWLLDLMVEVAKNEKDNKMSARNLAIVVSPNLFSITSDNPMYALTMSQKVAEFTFMLLDARLRASR